MNLRRVLCLVSVCSLLSVAMPGCGRADQGNGDATPAAARAEANTPSPSQADKEIVEAAPSETREGAERVQEQGVMTGADYVKLMNIQTRIYEQQTLSDADIAFAASLLRRGPLVKNAANETELRRLVMTYLSGRKNLTASQRNQLYDLVLPFLKDKNEWVRRSAINTLASTLDPRALVALDSVAQVDENPGVRARAKEMADRLRDILSENPNR